MTSELRYERLIQAAPSRVFDLFTCPRTPRVPPNRSSAPHRPVKTFVNEDKPDDEAIDTNTLEPDEEPFGCPLSIRPTPVTTTR